MMIGILGTPLTRQCEGLEEMRGENVIEFSLKRGDNLCFILALL
jgi:hypothetical protein